ncbi:DUF4062 domain-containing protein [Sphaerisporangium sp. NPDC005289]|uniref:DUF4062 domain-containing protein n=1 Tax=Sphaerisporangium sp. NPDC005289 TaxID=3155247 RepID=UPI0033BF3FCC
MERRPQVFISSTYRDLVEERREIMQALLELDCMPAGMELFPATNVDAWTLIKRVIDDCDYYLLVLGNRYGSLSDEGISYTEKEYDYALATGKPIVSFLHENPTSLPVSRSEVDMALADKLEHLKAKVQKKLVKFWRTPEQLGSVVSRSLVRLMKDYPAEGWVRGRHAATQAMLQELSNLRVQVAEMELEKAKILSSIKTSTYRFASGSERANISCSAVFSDDIFGAATYGATWEPTWDQLFGILSNAIYEESSSQDFLQELLEEVIPDGELKPIDTAFPRPIPDRLSVSSESMRLILIQFSALEYMKRFTHPETGNWCWKLTPEGERRYLATHAVASDKDASVED